jgi:hypothetical protein
VTTPVSILNKESNMKKVLLVSALAIVLTFAFCAVAFADHAPSFYIGWNRLAPDNSTGPHMDYTQFSSKCEVCHGVHRAPVEGTTWGGGSTGSVGFGTPAKPTWAAPAGANTQMLLRSSVADACRYCHIDTATGGVRLYNGLYANFSGGNPWASAGYAHNTACTNCHAVHGARTFKGAIGAKILRWDMVKFSNDSGYTPKLGGSGANTALNAFDTFYTDPLTSLVATTGVQDEIFKTGVAAGVGADSLPLFSGNDFTNVVNGTSLYWAGTTDAKNAQGAAFCTQCHANYSSAAETTINVDGDGVLFQGPWKFAGADLNAVTNTSVFRYKNHPVKPAVTTGWFSTGKTTTAGQVAWADATTCRYCHDAGETNASETQPLGYVVEQSYPHFTPGYYKFMTSAPNADSRVAEGGVQPNSNDGYLADGTQAPTPFALGGSALDDPTSPGASIGPSDGHCLKCHVSGDAGSGTAKGVGYTY